jgi:hypothetical protein
MSTFQMVNTLTVALQYHAGYKACLQEGGYFHWLIEEHVTSLDIHQIHFLQNLMENGRGFGVTISHEGEVEMQFRHPSDRLDFFRAAWDQQTSGGEWLQDDPGTLH